METTGIQSENEILSSENHGALAECKKVTSGRKDVDEKRPGSKNVSFGTRNDTSEGKKLLEKTNGVTIENKSLVPESKDVKLEKDVKLLRWSIRRDSFPLVSIRNALLKRRNLSPDNSIWRRRYLPFISLK